MADTSSAPIFTRDRIFTRWGQLKAERASFVPHWQELSMNLLPRNGRFFVQDRDRGIRKHNSILDNTGTRAVRTLGAGMMSGVTSPARPWFRLATADPDMMTNHDVKVWLKAVQERMMQVFARSNTYMALHQVYIELGVFGTAANVVMDDYETVIHHYPSTVGEFCIAANYRGKVDTLYREFQKTVGELVKEFGLENCSKAVQNLYRRGTLDAWVTVVHAIEPRADRDTTKLDGKNMAWKSVYFEIGADKEQYLSEGGYKTFPALCPRWDKAGGDIYGGSPGMEVLGDVKQLQHEQLRKANAIDYKTKPPLQVPTSLKGRNAEMFPGGITYVDTTGAGKAIQSMWDVNLDLQHLLLDIQDVRERVKAGFYADLFLLLSNDDRSGITATEVAERHEEKLLMIGPVLERLHNELLDPLVNNTFTKLLTAGALPPPPQALMGQEINVQYISILAQAQRAIGTQSIDRFVMQLGQIAQVKPDVLDKFDADKWADIYSDDLGVDPELVVASDQVALIRQQRAQQQAQAQAAQHANMAADTAQKLGNTPTTGGNAASDILNQFSGYGSGQQPGA
jgi:hypothetical protein